MISLLHYVLFNGLMFAASLSTFITNEQIEDGIVDLIESGAVDFNYDTLYIKLPDSLSHLEFSQILAIKAKNLELCLLSVKVTF